MFHRLFRLTTGLVALAIVGLLTVNLSHGRTEPDAPAMRPAQNPTSLQLLVDDGKILGWISGEKSFAGRKAAVTCDGTTTTVPVGDDNTFTWEYRVKAPQVAEVRVDDYTQHVNLAPRQQQQPVVYFALDRTVFRPGQPVQFAAFLRKVDARGRFVPVRDQEVIVLISAVRKGTIAGRVRLTTDDAGRVTGSYTFDDGDVLDSYRLTIPGFRGEAQVTLAEYRKSKIRLAIDGEAKDGKLHVAFDALDFLEKRVPKSKLRYIVQVVSQTAQAQDGALNPAQFALLNQDPATWTLEHLDEEERMLAEVDPGFQPGLSEGSAVVAQFDGDLAMDDGHAEYTLPIKQEWYDGRHAVRVQGVLTDANGHEQRAGKEIALSTSTQTIELSVEKRYVAPGEIIKATAINPASGWMNREPASCTLVVMRLAPGGTTASYPAYDASGIRPQAYSAISSVRPYWVMSGGGSVARTLVTAVPFAGGRAEVALQEPGAYTLTAIARFGDGATARSQVGCIVAETDGQPGLTMALDRAEYAAGDEVEARIGNRFGGARALVSLRDSAGIRWWKVVRLDQARERVRVKLDDDLSYGCVLDVQYPEDGALHTAQQALRVVPESRIVRITTKVKERVDAGERVKLNIEVNRKEQVDLVVSVYDKSLSSIAPDTTPDIRNYFLADTRVDDVRAREELRRRLAGVTLGEVLARAEAHLREHLEAEDTPREQQLRQAVRTCRNGYVGSWQLAALLDFQRVPIRYLNQYGQTTCSYQKDKAHETTLFQLIEDGRRTGRMRYAMAGHTLLMSETYGYPYYTVNNVAFYSRHDAFALRGTPGPASPVTVNGFASGNASVSGQALYSYLPAGGGFAPVELTAGDGIAVRRDFSDLAYWNARLRTDARGRAEVEFTLPDSLTNWQVVVTAVAPDLSVGRETASFTSTKPVMIWPMLPRAFTEGDRVKIFGSVQNRTDRDQRIRVRCKVENGSLLDYAEQVVFVKAGENATVYWTFAPSEPGFAQILMSVDCGGGEDASLKRLPVVPCTVEEVITDAGFCREAGRITVPDDIDPTRATLEVSVSPTLAADMADTLDYLVDYPYGCVEQTMSRFLPAIKVAQTLQHYRVSNPALEAKLPKCVDMGIKRLLEMQQADGGWGWNGSGQTHEMMTPYALYGLLEAEKAGYALGHRDAVDRGLARLRRFIDAMGEGQAADRIYCMYVYAHREPVLEAWWTFIGQQLDKGKLSDYAKALALEMAVEHGRTALAGRLSAALHASAQRSGGLVFWRTAGFSRWGDDSNEVTAAALKALVAHNVRDPLIPGALAYFAEKKQGNRWTSTKDTAMIVYAICDYLARADLKGAGGKTVTVTLNGETDRTLAMDSGLAKKVTLNGAALRRGVNEVRFANAAPSAMYRLCLRYRRSGTQIPSLERGITVSRRLYLLNEKGERVRQLVSGATVPRGAYLESEVGVTSHADTAMRYVLLKTPKPASCEILPADDPRFRKDSAAYVLREDKNEQVLYHHEQTSRSFIDRCVLHAELEGDYVIAPAAVELMYRPEICGHSGTFRLTVAETAK